MAIKGLAYTKTAWAFQERPVASAKLNTWDDRIEAALELAYFLLNQAWGGGSGVLRGVTADDLKTKATATPSLAIEVQPGYAFIDAYPLKLVAAVQPAAVTPPTTNPRIDLVQACLATWSIALKTGAESATPAAPSPDTGCIALAQLYLRPGMASIKDADDATNGYIIDTRTFL